VVTVGSTNPNLQATPKLLVDGMVGATKYCDVNGANCTTLGTGPNMYSYPASGICGSSLITTSTNCSTVVCGTSTSTPTRTCYYTCAGGCTTGTYQTYCTETTAQTCPTTYVGRLLP